MKLRDLFKGTPAHPPLVVDEITRLTEGWDMPAAPDPQCTATTRTGNRCKLPRTINSDKCAIHGR